MLHIYVIDIAFSGAGRFQIDIPKIKVKLGIKTKHNSEFIRVKFSILHSVVSIFLDRKQI